MDDNQLFDDLVHLAANDPQIQGDLLPVLERHAFFRKKKPGNYQDYIKDKKRKGEKPMSKEDWESKVKGKGGDKGEKDKGGDKGKQKLLDRGIMKFKPTPENIAAVGQKIVDSIKGDSLDLAQKYNLKELRKLQKQLKAIEAVGNKSKTPVNISRQMKQLSHALNMKGRGIGKKAALEAYLRGALVKVASANPGQVQDDLLTLLKQASSPRDKWELLEWIEDTVGISGKEWDQSGLRWYIEGRRRDYINVETLWEAMQEGSVDLRDHLSGSSRYMKMLEPHLKALGITVYY